MSAPSRSTVTVVSVGALLAAVLPIALLGADVVEVLTTDYGDLDLQGWTPPGPTERLAQAFTTVAMSPVLLTATLGLLVLAGLALAGLRVLLPLRVAGAVVAVVVAGVAVAAAVGTFLGAPAGSFDAWGSFDAALAASYAVPDAPTVGPLAFVTVISLTAGFALLRPGRS